MGILIMNTQENIWNKYKGAVIKNIRRGIGERFKYVYADIYSTNNELLVSADLDYCTNRMIKASEKWDQN